MNTENTKLFHIFISHSSIDAQWANEICHTLETRGLSCWLAPRNIVPGSEWGAAIIDGIDNSHIVLLIFSNEANESAQVRREIERAISKSIPVLPVRIEDIRPNGAMEFALSNTHWLDAFASPVEDRMKQLTVAVETMLGIKTKGPSPIEHASFGSESKPKLATSTSSLSKETGVSASQFSLPAVTESTTANPAKSDGKPTKTIRLLPIKRTVGALAILACLFILLLFFLRGEDSIETDEITNDEIADSTITQGQDITQQFEGVWRAEVENIRGRLIPREEVIERNSTLTIHEHTVEHRRQPTLLKNVIIKGEIKFQLIDGQQHFYLRGRESSGSRWLWRGIFRSSDDFLELCYRDAMISNGQRNRPLELPVRPESMLDPQAHYVRYRKVIRKP